MTSMTSTVTAPTEADKQRKLMRIAEAAIIWVHYEGEACASALMALEEAVADYVGTDKS